MMLLIAAAAHVAPAHARIEISEERSGMSCLHYDAGARLAWLRDGGDWRDADEVAHGERAFATQSVGNTGRSQPVEWDVTALARRWATGAKPAGGVFLRQLADDAASVRFHSRQATAASDHPRLVVEWSDGARNEWLPDADTTMTCTSASGKGGSRYLQVGNKRSTVLIFPFETRQGASVRRARLVLLSDKQFGKVSQVGVFRLDTPFATEVAAKSGLAAGFVLDEGIASHPAVVFATGFETRNWVDGWSSISRGSKAQPVARDDGNGFAPLSGQALRVTVEEGKRMGLNLLYDFSDKTGTQPEEMYFRYYLRFGNDWVPRVPGKMPGFAGTYGKAGWGGRRTDGTDGWSARGRYDMSPALGDGKYAMGFYVYHAGMSKKYGDGWGWNLGPTGVLERNRWYSVEQYVKLNTPGRDDGILRAWIDGVPVFGRADIRFRETRDLRIETLWMNVYHGGITDAPKDLSLYIDNVVIATQYIGPAGGVRGATAR